MTETQIKLIESAEVEFALHGFAGASVRAITSRAGANVAAINYHFGSKEALFTEMMRFRIAPVNEFRLALLDRTIEQASGQPIPVRQIIDILVRPLIAGFASGEYGTPNFARALGRCLTEETSFMAKLYDDILATLLQRFKAVLGQSLPSLPPSEIDYCFHFLGSSLSGLLTQPDRKKRDPDNPPDPKEIEDFINHFIEYITGGIERLEQTYQKK